MSVTPNKSKVSRVNEVAWGVYVWKLPNGSYLGDTNGDYLSVFCMKADLLQLAFLRREAEACGAIGGKPLFMPGAEKATQSQWEDQVARMSEGLIANPNDPGNWSDNV
jgi:hypothetical protein